MFDAWMQVFEDQLSGGVKAKNRNKTMKIIS